MLIVATTPTANCPLAAWHAPTVTASRVRGAAAAAAG